MTLFLPCFTPTAPHICILFKVTKKDLPDSRIELTLTVSPEATQRSYDTFVRDIEADTQLPGFRKGSRVPLPLLMQYRGGEEAFKGQALQYLIEQSAEEALKDYQNVAIQDSDRLESSVQELLKKFEPDRPLVFSISFDVMSELTWSASFKDIKVTVREPGNEETDRLNVDRYMRTMLKKNAKQKMVADRGLEIGDVAIVDVDFVRPDNREALPQLKQEKFSLDTDLPDMLDDVVQSLNRPFLQTVEDLKASLMMAESSRRAETLKNTIQDAILMELVKIVNMDVPEAALMETAKVKYQAMLLEWQAKGKLGPAAMESLASEAMLNNYMLSHKTELENDQKGLAAMQSVFEALQLTITDEELNAEVTQAEQEFQSMHEDYDADRLKEMAREVLQNAKVVLWFIENGNIEMAPYESPMSLK